MKREERAESVSSSLYTDVMTVNTRSNLAPTNMSTAQCRENYDFKLLLCNFSSKFTTFIEHICKLVVGSSGDFSSLEGTGQVQSAQSVTSKSASFTNNVPAGKYRLFPKLKGAKPYHLQVSI